MWGACLLAAAATGVATSLALVQYGFWALVWAWPAYLALPLTESMGTAAKWGGRGLAFTAFYMLVLWPLWRARAGARSGLVWVAGQLAVLTIVFHTWFVPHIRALLERAAEAGA